MASRGRRGGAPAREDEPRREERVEQQVPAPQGPVLPPPPPVDYGVFMQGLVQAMQTQAHTQAVLQAQLEAQKRPAATFQRQDKKKAVYQTQQRSVAVGSTQAFVAQLSLRSSILDEVIEQQKADPRLLELVGKADIARDEDGVIRFQHRVCVPDLVDVREHVLAEAIVVKAAPRRRLSAKALPQPP
ncbi:hypothetical protein Taro_000618 [Colocasia esculenta]|uniref:Uncharacterized protein n=1 Tax=Colocasia esculenta TaxID=4460 RepID=A0A843TBC6_COLES|nr:hypothetical protein [Colocasia esculenta]